MSMPQKLISLCLMLLFSNTSLGQMLEISVPEKVEEHELVILSFEHEGDALLFLENRETGKDIQYRALLTKPPVQAFVFTGPPGVYKLRVIVHSAETGFAMGTKFIDIGAGEGPRPPPPEDLPPPATGLAEFAKKAADRLDDPRTKGLLSKAYAEAANKIKDKPTIESTKKVIFDTLNEALKQRDELGFDKPWQEVRFAIDEEIAKLGPTSVESLRQMLLSISKGLE